MLIRYGHSKCYGIRSPSIGSEDVFWFDLMYTKPAHYYDITDTLSQLEQDWLNAWAFNFEDMNNYWWFRARSLVAYEMSWTQQDVLGLLTWLRQGKSFDELRSEANMATKTFKERFNLESKKQLQERLKAEAENEEQRKAILDRARYDELKTQREDSHKEARLRAREEMRLGLKLGLIKIKKED